MLPAGEGDGYAKPRVLSVQPADRSDVLRRRLLEPGEHEARGQLGKQLQKEGLALAPAAVDDSQGGPEGPVRRERRELRPLGISKSLPGIASSIVVLMVTRPWPQGTARPTI